MRLPLLRSGGFVRAVRRVTRRDPRIIDSFTTTLELLSDKVLPLLPELLIATPISNPQSVVLWSRSPLGRQIRAHPCNPWLNFFGRGRIQSEDTTPGRLNSTRTSFSRGCLHRSQHVGDLCHKSSLTPFCRRNKSAKPTFRKMSRATHAATRNSKRLILIKVNSCQNQELTPIRSPNAHLRLSSPGLVDL